MTAMCASDDIDLRYQRKNLSINVGEDLVVEFEFRHLVTGFPFDLTGWTLIAGLDTIPGAAVVPSPWVVAVVGNPVDGNAMLSLPAGLPVGRWGWWLSMRLGAAAPIHLVGGQLTVDAMSQFQSSSPTGNVVTVTFQGSIQVNVTATVGTGGASGDDLVIAHLIDPTPHPVYDDMPSIVLIFENHLL